MEYNSKKVDKHLFRGTATCYWWTGYGWRIQSKHKQCIRTLYRILYQKTYKPIVENEQLVFEVSDKQFKKIYNLMTEAYKSVVVAIGEVA